MKYPIILLLALLPLLSSCNKEETETDLWFRYAQTKCADSWDAPPVLFVTLEESVAQYFVNETEIIVEEIEVLPEAEEGEDCEACSCKTGTVIRVRVDEEFAEEMTAEGFVED